MEDLALKSTKEINIPVPWGHIAAKAWGDEKDTIVLAFHGIFDNAGSFDGLIPLLPNSLYYVCVDLPGHGRSSHFPLHLPVHTLNYIIVYKLIMAHFKRNRYIIMGHSYGGQIALLFSVLYPKLVEKLIMLDTISSLPVQPEDFKGYLVDKFDSYLLTEQKLSSNKEPTYTYEEALDKIQFNRNYGITITAKAAAALAQRAIEPVGQGRYRFTLDQRMKCWINPVWDFEYITKVLKRYLVRCPVLMVLGRDSEFQQLYMKPILDVLRDEKNVAIKIVDGNHDVHNYCPEIVAPLVNAFLLNGIAKL